MQFALQAHAVRAQLLRGGRRGRQAPEVLRRGRNLTAAHVPHLPTAACFMLARLLIQATHLSAIKGIAALWPAGTLCDMGTLLYIVNTVTVCHAYVYRMSWACLVLRETERDCHAQRARAPWARR
jgi:hypothetical protein